LCRADLTSDRGMEQLGACLEEHASEISGLVHCAATGIHRRLEELTERHFDWTLNPNVKVFFKLVQTILPQLRQAELCAQSSVRAKERVFVYVHCSGTSRS
jgi:NAD(P)-dependent dehydrogenase (short-subunit alcohol dehydrogenase family)